MGQRQDFAHKPRHGRLGTVRALRGAPGQVGPPLWQAWCPPSFRRWKTAAACIRPRSRALTKRFLGRPAEGMQGHRGFALPRAPGPRISLG